MAIDCTLACGEYEWTRALHDGRVEPEGVSLTTVDYPNPERFTRLVRHREFDACEFSMGSYLAAVTRDRPFPYTALPVFPYRKFRHSYMYRRVDAGIEAPADLDGRRVGLVNWQTTTCIWQRGVLAQRYGVDLSSIDWFASGREIVDLGDLAYDVDYREVREGSSIHLLEDMLDDGELDAILHPVRAETERGERLFERPIETERAYYRQTGVFPIMHAIVLRDDLIEDEPWVVQKLFDAFEAAKEIGLATLERPRWMPLLWSGILAERQRDLLGEDPWEYGLTEGNVETLQTLIEYATDQGVAATRPALEDLFATETLHPGWFGTETEG